MKLARSFFVLFLLAFLAGTQHTLAEGWSLSKLNPFSKTPEKKRERRKVIRPEPYRPSYILGTPTAFQQMDENVKKFFSKTKNFFTFNKKPRPRPNRYHNPKYNPFAQPQEKQSSWWPLFGPKNESSNEPRTVAEFLRGERPSFFGSSTLRHRPRYR